MERDRFVVGVPLGRWQTNCFVVGDRSEGSAVVIDPGETGASAVPKVLAEQGVGCEAILLTHGHLDHFWAVPELARELDVPVLLHPEDRWLWDNPAAGFGDFPKEGMEAMFGLRWDPPHERLEDLVDGQRLTRAGVTFLPRHTPGHTPGHVTFLAEGIADAEVSFAAAGPQPSGDGVLFSGDLIFAGSIGRTDFPRGSYEQIMRSIADTVLPLDDDTAVFSGHGPATTVGRERRTNPFVGQAVELT